MHGLAQVHFHIPANFVSEWDKILRFPRKFRIDFVVKVGRLIHAVIESCLKTSLFDLGRRVIAVLRCKILSFLTQNTMTVKVAVLSEVPHDIERVIDTFERSARLVTSVSALREIFPKNLLPLLFGHAR